VAIEQNGNFIGGVKDLDNDLKMADQLQPWEQFIVETDGKVYAFKQKVSNFYLGREIDHLKVVKLTPNRNEWEYFLLEPRGTNQFAIKSCHGTYLGLSGNHPTWTSNPNNTCIWTIKSINGQQNNLNQGGFSQGGVHQGGNYNQGGYNPGNQGYNPGNQGGNNSGNKGGFNQGGFTNNNTYGASNFGFQGGYQG